MSSASLCCHALPWAITERTATLTLFHLHWGNQTKPGSQGQPVPGGQTSCWPPKRSDCMIIYAGRQLHLPTLWSCAGRTDCLRALQILPHENYSKQHLTKPQVFQNVAVKEFGDMFYHLSTDAQAMTSLFFPEPILCHPSQNYACFYFSAAWGVECHGHSLLIFSLSPLVQGFHQVLWIFCSHLEKPCLWTVGLFSQS